jgi:hypothetical protein
LPDRRVLCLGSRSTVNPLRRNALWRIERKTNETVSNRS